MHEPDLRILPRFGDGVSFLYVEHAVIERKDKAIALYREDGVVEVPCASLATLALGPGTRITHAAIVTLASCGTTVLWVGEENTRFYATGTGKTRKSSNLLRQAAAWADSESRKTIVERLYRFRFRESLPAGMTIQQIRGREGVRVREAYAEASRKYGVPWAGRNYKRGNWSDADPVNRALSAGSSILYGVCHSGIVASGFSPAIGFIHEGKQLSFVYDIADLYKMELVIPSAFNAASTKPESPESATRAELRELINTSNLLPRLIEDLKRLFKGIESGDVNLDDEVERDDQPGNLWGPEGSVRGGENYAGDDA